MCIISTHSCKEYLFHRKLKTLEWNFVQVCNRTVITSSLFYSKFSRLGWTNVITSVRLATPLSDENKMLESLNGSVPALQADSHGVQIHDAPAPPYIFNRCRHGCVAHALKRTFSSAEILLLGPLTESTWMTVPKSKRNHSLWLPWRIHLNH